MENLVNPYPAKMEANLKLNEALAEVNSHGQEGDMMPVDRSILQQTLVLGVTWSRGTRQEQILARVAIPVMAAASAALDALLHTLNAFVKTVAIIPNAAVWAIRTGTPTGRLSIELGEALQHLAKAIGSVGLIAIAPLVASYDPEKALEISDKLMVTAGVTFLAEKMKIGPATLFEGWRLAQGATRKVAFAVSEVALNISWRPWRWMVTASVEQVKAHPYVVVVSLIAASYLGCSKAGYTSYIDDIFTSVTSSVNGWIDKGKNWYQGPSTNNNEDQSSDGLDQNGNPIVTDLSDKNNHSQGANDNNSNPK